MNMRELSNPPAKEASSNNDQYRIVLIVFLGAALVGVAVSIAAGFTFGNPVLLDAAISLGLSACILGGILVTPISVRMLAKGTAKSSIPTAVVVKEPMPERELELAAVRASAAQPALAAVPAPAEEAETPAAPKELPPVDRATLLSQIELPIRIWNSFRGLGAAGMIRVVVATLGILAIGATWSTTLFTVSLTTLVAAIAAGVCLIAAGLAATAVRYLADIEPTRLPEAPEFCRGARVVAWILVVAAASIGIEWAWQLTILRVLHFVVLAINLAVCYGLFAMKPRPEEKASFTFPLDLGVLSILGSRTNVLASILDAGRAATRYRSALHVGAHGRPPQPGAARHRPVLVGLALDVPDRGGGRGAGSRRASGRAVGRAAAPAGASPALAVARGSGVSDSGAARAGADSRPRGRGGRRDRRTCCGRVEHAANEYTLLLGNGRDLITVDAAVQFRIADARAWRYHSQNPADALRAIAYRAVMRSTVNRTLSDALSENVVTLTAQHARPWCSRMPTLSVSASRSWGSRSAACIRRCRWPPTIRPSSPRNSGRSLRSSMRRPIAIRRCPPPRLPWSVSENTARAEGAEALARAAGEAWSFRTLESQYRAAPEEYLFRRRLETLEKGLAGRRFTVVDSRFQRDGGELWVMP